ncbi:hypothetical protein AQUCO_05800046v1 [Aquilegia coerulea]|uniref:B box-type domain-containing protein n=1 Tax=Aquilegia coerulea TaxID=218851 RepID=A0A2G5CEH4_AQUCA|nr:hypothetical protein AQUCO_05800046v1 [Aquilegia coerulea]
MKIQCDVCEKAQATVICCADEAALCAKCDVEVHEANRLASKHQRLLLDSLSTKLPRCDICQEKTAFIFCVEDRALFCQDCDEPVHSAGSIASNHQRLLATGIKVALGSKCAKNAELIRSEPPNQNSQPLISKSLPTPQPSTCTSPTSWAIDDLLQFSDFDTNDKKESIGFGDQFEWFTDIGLFNDQVPQETLAAAEVPQLPVSKPSNLPLHRSIKSYMPPNKKPRIEVSDDEEYFTVPDLG